MRTFIYLFFSSFGICFSSLLQAQNPPIVNSADIYLQMKKLNVLGSVLYVAAHPDDENNTLLPYLAKGALYKTAYLSLTRGDGGQNLIGDEQGFELGLIRTEELLAARSIDGSGQYFSRAFEFGFSKSADEALHIWDKDKVLADIVWVIRQYQPDVIITRFPRDKRAGHGHHWASAILANEAFIAAANSAKFPEQFKYGVQPWQAKRILWNTYNFGSINTTANDQLKMAIGGYNPLLGESYGEIGGEARSMHKSQGEGRPRREGRITEYFTTTGGTPPDSTLMDGINITWSRMKGGAAIIPKVNALLQQYNIQHPENSLPALVDLYHAIQQLPEKNTWIKEKLKEVVHLIANCSGLMAEATSSNEYGVEGQNMQLQFFVNKRLPAAIQLKKVTLMSRQQMLFDTTLSKALHANDNIAFERKFPVALQQPVSQPYWLVHPMENVGMFTVNDQTLIGRPESPPAYTAAFTFTIDDVAFTIQKAVQYKYSDPVRGEVYQPFVVIPPVMVNIQPNVVLSNVQRAGKQVSLPVLNVQLQANYSAAGIPVKYQLQQGNTVIDKKDTVLHFETGKNYVWSVPLMQVFHAQNTPVIHPSVTLPIQGKNETYDLNVKKIAYQYIPTIHYFYTDSVKVITEPVKVVGTRVAYIAGAGDKLPDAIQQLGYQVQLLQEQDITDEKLRQFDAVVIGIRAYNIHEYLTTKNDVFNRYIYNGGNLIIQYFKSNFINNKPVKAGPYPFQVNGSPRVTEENSPVQFLLPKHSVLNFPNTINEKNFDGWVQERSTYQAQTNDSHFEAPLSMHDTGEAPSSGSLLIAPYGKGNVAYVSLVLFRQLPAGIPGAYKLLANLIALPKHEK
ncbi:PIG-L family deacetylase [Hydrotalea sp.]|uniref:PIG-L family deacetylase n=1 Tax=Hydrotalea sp. TaxID=2881279 RepID=UPI0026114F2E|nr:PIG-L family deacetylase [Hydrotalea sp.]